MKSVEELLQAWVKAVSEAQFHEACAFCAPNGARRRALHKARMAEQRAAKIAKILRTRHGIDPNELRNGEIK